MCGRTRRRLEIIRATICRWADCVMATAMAYIHAVICVLLLDVCLVQSTAIIVESEPSGIRGVLDETTLCHVHDSFLHLYASVKPIVNQLTSTREIHHLVFLNLLARCARAFTPHCTILSNIGRFVWCEWRAAGRRVSSPGIAYHLTTGFHDCVQNTGHESMPEYERCAKCIQ